MLPLDDPLHFSIGWLIGIALASALHLPIEVLLFALRVPVIDFAFW